MEYGPSPNDCEMKLFSTTPKAEKDREMSKLIRFYGPKCTRTTFSRNFALDPTGRAYSAPPDPLAGGQGGLLPGLYLSNFIRGGSKFWLLKSTALA